MKNRKLHIETLEERALLAVVAGGMEQVAEAAMPTEATEWVVNTLEDPTSWDATDEVVSLREAIDSAQMGDTITFDESLAGGTVTLYGNQLEITKGITIDASSIDGITINADGKSRVFYINGGDATNTVELIGLTITCGQADSGGGIYNKGTLTITNSTISGNTASSSGADGGGICNVSGTLTITNCTISENTCVSSSDDHCSSSGVGIYNSGGTLTITSSRISKNTSFSSSSSSDCFSVSYGGGIFSYSGTLTITNSIISENTICSSSISSYYHCASSGGGIYNGGALTISNTTISGNTSSSSSSRFLCSSQGGGIINFGTLTITNSNISRNTSISSSESYIDSNGGGIDNHGTLTISNTTISENSASDFGGGIYNYDNGTLTVTNSTISGNTAKSGSGIVNDVGLAKLYNTIIAQNSTGAGNDEIRSIGSSIYAYNSLSTFIDWTESENCTDYDLSLPLFTDPDHGDYTLIAGSQALNIGNNNYVTAEIDLAGNPRIVAGIVDLGAYEYQPETHSTIVTTPSDVVDEFDGLISLREAINYATTRDVITFDSSLAEKTIILNGVQLEISKRITIDALDIGGITIDAGKESRILNITQGDKNNPVILKGITFTNGTIDGDGGAIRNDSGALTITECVFLNNSVFNGYGGGAVFNDTGIVDIERCIFSGGFAREGGAVYTKYGRTTLVNCSITNNSTGGDYGNGGGIYCHAGTTNMVNCLVYGNTAQDGGGGIASYSGAVTLINCTVAGNSASKGGGIYNSWGTWSVNNSIISFNFASGNNSNVCASYSGHNNLIDFNESFQLFNVAPVFDESGNLTNLDEIDLSLSEKSIAINGGDNALVTTDSDVLGNSRIYTEGDSEGIVDVGAIECQKTIQIEPKGTVVTTSLDIFDITDQQISLREAVSYAESGDVITFDSSLSGEILVLDGVEIVIDKNVSIDASSIDGITIDGNKRSRVFRISGGSTDAPIEITSVTITGAYHEGDGGGIYNTGHLKLTDCVFTGNVSDGSYAGGGFSNHGGTVDLLNCSFSENVASSGAAFHTDQGKINISNCSFVGNTADYGGGAFYSWYGEITISQSTFSNNSGTFGGAMSFYGPVTATNIVVSNNRARDGAGIYDRGILFLSDSIVSDNEASVYGGGICSYYGSMSLSNVLITGNSGTYGGGIESSTGNSLELSHCSILNNNAYRGGGILNYGNLTLTNSVTCKNNAQEDGGGICNGGNLILVNSTVSDNNTSPQYNSHGVYNHGSSYFYNSIIAQNNSIDIVNDEDKDIRAYSTLTSFEDWTESENTILYDPSIPLFFDEFGSDYSISGDSQAVNAGDNSYVTWNSDLSGNSRIVGEVVDLGAYEYPDYKQLESPSILTGSRGNYVSFGANRHQIIWGEIEHASGYELAYSGDGGISWTSIETLETNAVVTGLTYGTDVTYRVRALRNGLFISSDWSAEKTFNVCPMDINADGDITSADRLLLSKSWLAEEGDDRYEYYCDLDGDSDISNSDRFVLSANWLKESDDPKLLYPRPLAAADTVFAEFASADFDIDLDEF